MFCLYLVTLSISVLYQPGSISNTDVAVMENKCKTAYNKMTLMVMIYTAVNSDKTKVDIP